MSPADKAMLDEIQERAKTFNRLCEAKDFDGIVRHAIMYKKGGKGAPAWVAAYNTPGHIGLYRMIYKRAVGLRPELVSPEFRAEAEAWLAANPETTQP